MKDQTDWLLLRRNLPPFDSRRWIRAGDSLLDRRSFEASIHSDPLVFTAESARKDFVKALVRALRARKRIFLKRYCTDLTSFFAWVDSNNLEISTQSAISVVAQFSQQSPRDTAPEKEKLGRIQLIIGDALGLTSMQLQNELRNNDVSAWLLPVPHNPRRASVDLRCLAAPEFTKMQSRNFLVVSEERKNTALTLDPGRTEFVRDLFLTLQAAITSSNRSDGFPGELSAVKRLMGAMDEKSLPVNRRTVFALVNNSDEPLLRPFRKSSISNLQRCLSWMCKTDDERLAIKTLQLRTSVFNRPQLDHVWALQLPQASYPSIDLRYLIRPGDVSKKLPSFMKLTEEERELAVTNTARKDLVWKSKEAWLSELSYGRSHRTVHGSIQCVARFLTWCDSQNIVVSSDSLVTCLAKFFLYKKSLAISFPRKLNSVIRDKSVLTGHYAEVLNLTTSYISERLPNIEMPQASGRTGDYVSADDVAPFTGWLKAIVEAVSLEVIDAEHPNGITVRSGDKSLIIPTSKFRSKFAQPRFFHLSAVQYRIEAELLRFISLTGANLAPALALRLSELNWEPTPGGYLIKKFKGRKGGDVTYVIPKRYRADLIRHIEFVKALVPNPDDPRMDRVFPMLTTESQAHLISLLAQGRPLQFKSASHDTNAQNLRYLFQSNGIRFLSARALRYAAGDWTISAKDGDILRASTFLGNTPRVAYSFYGGLGNLTKAKREFSTFWDRFESDTSKSVAPGLCNDPNRPVPISNDSHLPKCGSENACFFCAQYRGIDNLDYVHLILTRLDELKIRTLIEPSRTDEYRFIGVELEKIVSAYCSRHEEHGDAVERLRQRVAGGLHHENLRGSIELLRVSHGL